MSIRVLALLAFAITPLAARAADEENPFKNAKVGDYARYDTVLKSGATEVKTVRIQTITAVSDKEVSLKTVTEINGKEMPGKKGDQKIDLTKPFDAANAGEAGPAGIKWEKVKDGKEKVKVGNKEYDCTWTTYKPVLPKADVPVEGEVKVWLSKDIPFVVKRTLNLKIGSSEIVYSTELTEFGKK